METGNPNWLEKALEFYNKKETFTLIDNATIGLKQEDLRTAFKLLKAEREKRGMTVKEIMGLFAGIGITGVGVWMVAAAIADPEPTSKLGFLIGGGVLMSVTGSMGILASLGVKFTVSVKTPKGSVFEIKPEEKKIINIE